MHLFWKLYTFSQKNMNFKCILAYKIKYMIYYHLRNTNKSINEENSWSYTNWCIIILYKWQCIHRKVYIFLKLPTWHKNYTLWTKKLSIILYIQFVKLSLYVVIGSSVDKLKQVSIYKKIPWFTLIGVSQKL